MIRSAVIVILSSWLLHDQSPAQSLNGSLRQRLIDAVSIDTLAAHIKTLQFAGGHYSRVNFTPGNDSAVVYIKGAFTALRRLTSVEYDTFYIPTASSPFNVKPLENIVASIDGKRDPSRTYIIGAHLDCSASRMGNSTWNQQWRTIRAPGADDNATGVAAILELARVLSDSSLGFSNDYTLRFVAFGAEESGPAYPIPPAVSHAGSTHYVQTLKSRAENILGMISIDMIGYNQFYDYLAVVSNSSSQWLGRAITSANDSNAIGLITNRAPFPSATFSDHNSFWLQGYPAICLIENSPPWNDSAYYKANPYYHTSRDTFETLNMPLVKKVTQATLAAIVALNSSTTDVGPGQRIAQVSQTYELFQNFPNPFNPSTTIEFSLPQPGDAILRIYNLMGELVTTLVDARLPAGQHRAVWDAASFPSGVYFARLQSQRHVATKKLVLAR